MEPQQNNPEPVVSAPAPVVKKCNNKVITAILVIVALGSLGFAGFEFWQGMKKDAEITDLKAKQTVVQQPVAEPEKESETIPVSDVEEVLAKYVGEKNNVVAYMGAYYTIFTSEFDDTQKVYMAYSGVKYDEKKEIECTDEWHERGACTGQSIDFDTLNEKYTTLFGDYSTLEKKDYSFQGFYYLIYDEDINGYREYIFPGGGTTGVRAAHKAVSAKKDGDDIVATLAYAELNLDVEIAEGISGPTLMTSDFERIDELVDSMAIYDFTLSPYEDSYVLTKVEKR